MENEKETGFSCNTDADNSSICRACSSYSTYYANANDLRDRVYNMLASGISTVTILLEIKEDKNCTAMQKRQIMKENHLE